MGFIPFSRSTSGSDGGEQDIRLRSNTFVLSHKVAWMVSATLALLRIGRRFESAELRSRGVTRRAGIASSKLATCLECMVSVLADCFGAPPRRLHPWSTGYTMVLWAFVMWAIFCALSVLYFLWAFRSMAYEEEETAQCFARPLWKMLPVVAMFITSSLSGGALRLQHPLVYALLSGL
mmetsp:Transcript_48535/g.135650  ORF Transcript_48535/g.135650 Transcript_48535/m.135650 type:complete len:178 (+) Transcript_48535:78-611(+)